MNLELPETLALSTRTNGSSCRYRGKWSGPFNKWVWKRVEIASTRIMQNAIKDCIGRGINA